LKAKINLFSNREKNNEENPTAKICCEEGTRKLSLKAKLRFSKKYFERAQKISEK
jgi:hypothetical protein